MTNPYIQDYADQTGQTYDQASRELVRDNLTSVPAHLRDKYATVEEYQEAMHEFFNGQ